MASGPYEAAWKLHKDMKQLGVQFGQPWQHNIMYNS